MDDPTEHAQEHIHHEATHGHGPRWITAAALTAAILAAFAAISSSLATTHLTASTLKRIEANDNWTYYQSKSIKSSIIDSRTMEFNALEPTRVNDAVRKQHQDDIAKKAEYATKPDKEKDPEKPQGLGGIQNLANSLQDLSEVHLQTHERYEMSATMFHIAIAVVAIAVVAKRKEFWYVSMVGGVVGLGFFGYAFVNAPAESTEKPEAPTALIAPAPPREGAPATHSTGPATEVHAGGEAAH